jgi:hypothetical protein
MSRQYQTFKIADIVIGDRMRSTINEDVVLRMMESIKDGRFHTEPFVREADDKVSLVAGLHRLEAHRRIGHDEIDCRLFHGTETEAKMMEIEENLARAELTVLERSEHLDEWRKLALAKDVQVAHPGGRQPSDRGHSKTASKHSTSREEVRRAETIASLAPEAKQEARTANLDNNQAALIEAAKAPTPEAQVAMIQSIKAHGSVESAKHAAMMAVNLRKPSNPKPAIGIDRFTTDLALELRNSPTPMQKEKIESIIANSEHLTDAACNAILAAVHGAAGRWSSLYSRLETSRPEHHAKDVVDGDQDIEGNDDHPVRDIVINQNNTINSDYAMRRMKKLQKEYDKSNKAYLPHNLQWSIDAMIGCLPEEWVRHVLPVLVCKNQEAKGLFLNELEYKLLRRVAVNAFGYNARLADILRDAGWTVTEPTPAAPDADQHIEQTINAD